MSQILIITANGVLEAKPFTTNNADTMVSESLIDQLPSELTEQNQELQGSPADTVGEDSSSAEKSD